MAQGMRSYKETHDTKLQEDATSSLWTTVLQSQFPFTDDYCLTSEHHSVIRTPEQTNMEIHALVGQE